MKKTFKVLGIIIGLVIVGYFVLDYIANSKLKNFLDGESRKGKLEYANSSVSLISGSATIEDLIFYPKKDTLKAEKIGAEGFSLYAFLVDSKISVERVFVQKPNLLFSKSKKDSTQKSKKQGKSKLNKPIEVGKFVVQNGSLSQFKKGKKSMEVQNFSIDIEDIRVTQKSLNQKIPFDFGAYQLGFENIFLDLNNLEKINVKKVLINRDSIHADKIEMKSKFSKKRYIDQIPYEKDLIDINSQGLTIRDYTFDFIESTPHFEAKEIELSDNELLIYRDKTVKDDPRKKVLYSQMLRELPAKIRIDLFTINKTKITYEERLKKDRKPGKVFFEEFNAEITDLTNIDLNREKFPTTKMDISTRFMDTSPLEVTWTFKINDKQDRFQIQGSSFSIPPRAMNPFFVPAFNVKADGSIDELYFNFTGNQNQAQGDFKMVYEDFKVKVLRKNEDKKNGFLSFVANVLVNNDNSSQKESVHVSNVERDKTKSFWNYFWKCIEAGLKKTVI